MIKRLVFLCSFFVLALPTVCFADDKSVEFVHYDVDLEPCLNPAVKPSHSDDKPITQDMIDELESNGWIYKGQNEKGVYEFIEMPYKLGRSLDVNVVPESSISYTVEGWGDSVYMSFTSVNGIITIPSNTFDEFVADYIMYGNCTLSEELPPGTTFKNVQVGFALTVGYADTTVEVYDQQLNKVRLKGPSNSYTDYDVTCTIPSNTSNKVSYWKTDDTTQTNHSSNVITLTDKIEVFTYAIGEDGGQIYPYDFVFVCDIDSAYITNNAINAVGDKVDKVKDSVDKQTADMNKNHEETKGILNGLPGKIADAITGVLQKLFVPSDDFISKKMNEFSDKLDEHLGFLAFPVTASLDLLDIILSARDTGSSITFPSIHVPMNGKDYVIAEETSVNLNDVFIRFPVLEETLHLLTSLMLLLVLVSKAYNLWSKYLGQEPVDVFSAFTIDDVADEMEADRLLIKHGGV